MQAFFRNLSRLFKKLWNRFSNYHNSKKRFIVYLIVLTIVLIFFSMVKISADINGDGGGNFMLLSGAYIRSFIIVALSLLFLLGWNISVKFKKIIMQFFSLREEEPLVDFIFLWIITSVFMGIVDTVSIAQNLSPRIFMTRGAIFAQLMLMGGLVRSFVTLWMNAKKTSRRTKILNIPDENTSHRQPEIVNHPRKPMNHLFDELDNE
ncbi:hypothetical protein AGMMS50249_2940 [candidate division SR1 bacterium]|nr:hypothetical protein AGMMS50249_2940 [candidate division SR1 bacterium]